MPQQVIDALMAQGVPPEQAAQMAYPQGMPPGGPQQAPMAPGGPGMGAAPSEDEMLAQLLEAVLQKWSGTDAQIAGEKGVLLQALMQIAQAPESMSPQEQVEGGMGVPAPVAPSGSMMPASQPGMNG